MLPFRGLVDYMFRRLNSFPGFLGDEVSEIYDFLFITGKVKSKRETKHCCLT
jgi:hypothetical protein